MLKKSGFLLASYSNLTSFCCPHTGLPHLSFPVPLPLQQKPPRWKQQQWRCHSTIQFDSRSLSDDLSWPAVSMPSPYQIFHLSPRDAYSKGRFYTLVKIYHPDRSTHSHIHSHIHNLPGAIKMERYRLIVAANDILSDPEKRKAYDRNGAGWNNCIEYGFQNPSYNWSQTSGEARWSGFDTNDSPFQNATWEDWERWYNRHEKQKPIYTNNGGFLSLVIVAVVLGAFGQAEQVSRHNEFFKQQIEAQNEEVTQMVLNRRQESRKAADMDSRLQKFFRQRDMGVQVALGDLGNERDDRKILPEPVTCMSDTQRKRSRRNEDSCD